MSKVEFDRARKQYPGMIVFKVVRGIGERVIAIQRERAKEASAALPNWTFGALHGCTVHLR